MVRATPRHAGQVPAAVLCQRPSQGRRRHDCMQKGRRVTLSNHPLTRPGDESSGAAVKAHFPGAVLPLSAAA